MLLRFFFGIGEGKLFELTWLYKYLESSIFNPKLNNKLVRKNMFELYDVRQ